MGSQLAQRPFYWDFSDLRIARERRLKQLNPELRPLIRELNRRQVAGENMQYSMHIYREIRWRLNFTPDVARTRSASKISVRASTSRNNSLRPRSSKRMTAVGDWASTRARGTCGSITRLKTVSRVTRNRSIRSRLLDRINSPEKLDAQLDSVLYR